MSTTNERQAGQGEPVYGTWEPIAGPLGLDRFGYGWAMEYAERFALIGLLEHLRPPVAIEIGTHLGGSLGVIAAFAGRAYSLDIDPGCAERLRAKHPNVEFVTGSSRVTLRPLIERLDRERAGLGFVLIDGDHSEAGARADAEDVLRFRPTRPLYVLLHDSFNPDVRRGIRSIDWQASPFVHLVEVDFIPGTSFDRTAPPGQMWGGLALAVLLPEPRRSPLRVIARHDFLFQTALRASPHGLAHEPVSPPLPRLRRGLLRRLARLVCRAS
jgi:hypothetical protein